MGGGTGASLIKGWAKIPESYVETVSVLTLDRVLGDTIYMKRALILADVEGSEWQMLQGAVKTIASCPKPRWMLEICFSEHWPQGQKNPNFIQIFNVFLSNGYRAYNIVGEQFEEITLDQVHQIADGKKLLDNHNFIFQ